MEQEERPAKIRKLSHDNDSSASVLLSLLNEQHDPSKPSQAVGQQALQQDQVDDGSSVSGTEAQQPKHQLEPNDTPQIESTAPLTSSSSQPLSKSALKKQRRKEKWEAGKAERKAKQKEKDKQKKELKREQARQEAELRQAKGEPTPPPPEKLKYKRPTRLPVTFMIDCAFDDKMLEKELVSLASQVTRAYSENYKGPFQAHLVVSSWGGLLKERFDTVLRADYKQWKGIRFTEQDFVAAAEMASEKMRGPGGGKMAGMFEKYQVHSKAANGAGKKNPTQEPGAADTIAKPNATKGSTGDTATEARSQSEHATSTTPSTTSTQPPKSEESPPDPETVYLTSDSPNTLTHLSPNSTYIIGGIVDKNRHKGLCYKLACDRGVKTAKLPIGEFMEMQSRHVLATNHVVEIMLRWLEFGDWGKAFLSVIPQRKGARLRGAEKMKAGVEGENGDGAGEVGSDGEEDGEEEEEHQDGSDGDSRAEVAIDETEALEPDPESSAIVQ